MRVNYHWGDERRLAERRRRYNPNYVGPERRVADERRVHPPEKRRLLAPILAAIFCFVTVDTAAWDGYYRRAMFHQIDNDAATTREWSANIWHLG